MATSHDGTCPCDLLQGPVAGTSPLVCADLNCGESSVTIFGYDNSYFLATPCRLDQYFFCVMFVVTVVYKVKIYTLILEVILFKGISYWSRKIDR